MLPVNSFDGDCIRDLLDIGMSLCKDVTLKVCLPHHGRALNILGAT